MAPLEPFFLDLLLLAVPGLKIRLKGPYCLDPPARTSALVLLCGDILFMV